MNNDEKWTYNLESDGTDTWIHDVYDSKEIAIKEGTKASKEYKCNKFYVGRQELDAVPAIDVDTVIENIQEYMYDEYGEFAEGYLDDVKKEDALSLEKDLNTVLQKWIKKNKYEPNFYHILDVETIRVEELDNE